MRPNRLVILLLVGLLAAVASVYFSERNRTSRAYQSMLEDGRMDLEVIDAFIKASEPQGPEYYQALNLAAMLDDDYLYEVVALYAEANILLKSEVAGRILALLPSESVTVNTAAGRALASIYLGLEDPQRAVPLLEYSALRADKDAAEYLSRLYQRFGCPVAAVTWAQVANQRERISPCDGLPVGGRRLSEENWGHVVHNQAEIRDAWAEGELPLLQYSPGCRLVL